LIFGDLFETPLSKPVTGRWVSLTLQFYQQLNCFLIFHLLYAFGSLICSWETQIQAQWVGKVISCKSTSSNIAKSGLNVSLDKKGISMASLSSGHAYAFYRAHNIHQTNFQAAAT
jgi:hypothetical protein